MEWPSVGRDPHFVIDRFECARNERRAFSSIALCVKIARRNYRLTQRP